MVWQHLYPSVLSLELLIWGGYSQQNPVEPGTWPPIKLCISLELVIQRQNRSRHVLPLWTNWNIEKPPFVGRAAAQSLFHSSPWIKRVISRQCLGVSLGQEGRDERNELFLLISIQQPAQKVSRGRPECLQHASVCFPLSPSTAFSLLGVLCWWGAHFCADQSYSSADGLSVLCWSFICPLQSCTVFLQTSSGFFLSVAEPHRDAA